jgi:hypothetical protein
MPEPITTAEQVPEAYLRLVNIVSGLDEMAAHAHALIDDVGDVLATFGVPVFETEAENEAVYARAEALRGSDA